MIKQVVILAAGMGTRLQNVLKDVPKGFLEIEGKTLIDLSVENLKKAGITRIIIVTGHLSHFYDELAEKETEIKIETIKNEVFAESGSMYSFWCARELINEDFLVLESDLIYEIRALTELQRIVKENAILLSGATNSGDEVYVETKSDKIFKMSKNKDSLRDVTGELVGISKISLNQYRTLTTIAEKLFEKSLKVEYEECLVETAKVYPIYYHFIKDLIWSEIDDESHLKRVKEQILPKMNF